MKKILLALCCYFFLASLSISTSSCSRKVGCPAYENVHVKADKKGRLPTKGGNSALFPKNMRKKKRG
jgi:hypothetical protein